MRKQVLFILAIAIAAISFAQKGNIPRAIHLNKAVKSSTPKAQKPEIHIDNEDILFYEDFDGARWAATSNEGLPVPENAPVGWELNDYTGGGYYWRWDTLGPRGKYTSPGDEDDYCHNHSEPLHSSTEQNGFLTFEADYFNTWLDCGTIGGANDMDGDVTCTIPLDFSDQEAVHLVFEQYSRFCCEFNATSDVWFEVSTDGGETWIGKSVHATTINQASENPQISTYNITSMVAGEPSVIFRFRIENLSHYHWEIDDVRFVVPKTHDIKLVDYWNQYIESYSLNDEDLLLDEPQDFKEGFYHYPWFLTQNYVGFNAAFVNFGANDLTNVVHNVQINKNGQTLTTFTSDPINNVPVNLQDTTEFAQNWTPDGKGTYEILHFLTCSEGDENPVNDTLKRQFIVGDSTICPADTTTINQEVSPHYWLFHEEGRGLGFQMTIPEPSLHGDGNGPDNYTVSGVRIYLPPQVENGDTLIAENEASFIAELYKYNHELDSLELVIQSSPRVLTLNDTASWIYIPFSGNGQDEVLYEGGKYILNVAFWGTYIDENGRATSVTIGESAKYKPSWESCVLVEPNGTDYNSIIVDGTPAIALSIHFDDDYPVTEHEVTFNIKNNSNEPISSAKIRIGGKQTHTNVDGETTITLENGTYDYTINATGYGEETGTITINDETTTVNETLYSLHEATFEVMNSFGDKIQNAKIQLSGKNLITNEDGLASTFLISGTYTYTITKFSFNEYTGNITVSDGDITEIITDFDKTNYAVNFTVQDNENTALEGAQVNIGENSIPTDANGQATIQGNFGSNEYTVSKDGYETATGYLMLFDETEVAVTLNPVYTVTFIVESNEPIEGALIEIAEQTLVTNASGEATIELPDGEYAYTVTKEGYEETSGTIIVDGDDYWQNIFLCPHFTVTFIALDENGDPMEGMTIYINGDTLTTNENGEASIDLVPGDYDYVAIVNIYQTIQETVTVTDSDVTVPLIHLGPCNSIVLFYVNVGSQPAEGAIITINNETIITDQNGYGEIYLDQGEYLYTISYQDFEDLSGTIVVDEISENVYIDFLGIDELEKSLEMYPNPASGNVYFKLETNARISILNLSGKKVKTATINKSGSINLTGIKNGVYIVEIETANKHTSKILIIRK